MKSPKHTFLFGKNYHWIEVDGKTYLGRCAYIQGVGCAVCCADPYWFDGKYVWGGIMAASQLGAQQ